MYKIRFAALVALIICTPGAYLHAETPAESSAPTAAEKPEADKPKAPPLAQLLKNADANGDQKVDLAEIHAKVPKFPEKRFERLDKNQDGFIDASEIPQAPKVEGEGAARGAMREKLKAADTDKDGKLSQAEYTAGFPNVPADRFAKLDRNGDGFVDRSDREGVEAAMKQKKGAAAKIEGNAPADTSAYASDLVTKHDADQDGKLTQAELEAAKPGFPEKTFAAMDRNKDGALSAADFATAAN